MVDAIDSSLFFSHPRLSSTVFSSDVIQDICRTVTLERRPPWDVVIRQNDPGETLVEDRTRFSQTSLFVRRFYIILQGAVNIYRLDDESTQPIQYDFDPVTKLAEFDEDPEQREQLIAQTFGSYVVTLGEIHLSLSLQSIKFQSEDSILVNGHWLPMNLEALRS